MPADVTLYADQQLPATAISWLDPDGNPLPLAAGHTFHVELVDDTGTIAFSKSTGVTGANTAPNATIAWADGDLDGLAGLYRLRLVAVDGTGARRVFRPENLPVVHVRPTPTVPAAG